METREAALKIDEVGVTKDFVDLFAEELNFLPFCRPIYK